MSTNQVFLRTKFEDRIISEKHDVFKHSKRKGCSINIKTVWDRLDPVEVGYSRKIWTLCGISKVSLDLP